MKVSDLIREDVDIDVYDDICDYLAIAFCGPLELTEAGKQEFSEVLGYDVRLNNGVAIVCCDGPEGVWQKKLRKAKAFFEAAAGYCTDEDFRRWFRG